MGRMKFRQGKSINIGLTINRPKTKEPVLSNIGQVVERQKNWLVATILSFVKPFTKVAHKFQQYRRKV